MTVDIDDDPRLAAYDYDLPSTSIAAHPTLDRDGARLMVLSRGRGTLAHSAIRSLATHLRAGDLLVANNSRVLRSRVFAERSSGGRVEVFLLGTGAESAPALLRPARRLGVGETLTCSGGTITIVAKPDADGIARVTTNPSPIELMERAGSIPLPPYLRREAEPADDERYQTVFAGPLGSSAAPTAGLHLTPELLADLEAAGVGFATVTLHVGLGTFRPLRPEDLDRGELHEEQWEVSEATAAAIRATRAAGGRVIAVGTTSARTLESAVGPDGLVHAGHGATRIFIQPPHDFRAIDGLLTNFHLPRSSLMMLVAALVTRERLIDAYEVARDANYRFYSYGDAMLLL